MKPNYIPQPALTYLIIGLLIITVTPIMGRYFPLPDFLRGFLSGLGLTLEFIGVVKIKRNKKKIECGASNDLPESKSFIQRQIQ